MQRGLNGRRIAVFDASKSRARDVVPALEGAGALVHQLQQGDPDEHWHGGRYAALIVIGAAGARGRDFQAEPRLVQLVREFLVSDKPVAALDVPLESIQADETLLAVRGSGDASAFAGQVVREFSTRLEEHDLDEMSEMSFPASDPPALNPGTAGHAKPQQEDREAGRGERG